MRETGRTVDTFDCGIVISAQTGRLWQWLAAPTGLFPILCPQSVDNSARGPWISSRVAARS
jgi:hypothetical protein